ncbi:FixH family protein [Roseomonas sp. OT10]|uniref:FixH family protein n=1 Tax=Roseomonas cutis TaxID=2897332 RepID=UPI001E451696|nr:FixH family protein [Roseomonas sp. OT10]UFN51506.1 FixH family protein [Roseomonas sp. OT10]
MTLDRRTGDRDPHGYDPRRGRWIPWAIAGGMAVVVAVNAVLITAAVTTFTGITTSHPYEAGRDYNRVLEEAARQDALGWRATLRVVGGVLELRVADREGLPLSGRVEGVLQRPVDGRELPLDVAAVAPGRWQAALREDRPGLWQARLRLTAPDGAALDVRERLVLP